MRILLALFALTAVLAAQTSDSSDPVRTFYRGAELFEQQDFAGAVAAYETALSAESSPELLFNLGTACLHADENGKALYYLLLASRLSPRDEDIARNLAVARERAIDEIPQEKSNPLIEKLLVLHRETTPRESFALFTLFFMVGMAFLHVRLASPNPWFLRIGLVLVIIGLSFAASAWSRREAPRDQGVILGPEVGVFSGPGDVTYQIFFKLHAGAEVQVLEELDSWVKIAVGDKRGYVQASAIGVL